ncbi:NAD(P)-binding protein [Lentinula aciculospora]|uniref:NAD(P)-binding protein n=1 Tax=Lentinula aciculospora TaxID=153920 RepID=A0A9W8ZW53_9AGAR|nr:NAD(P)-binding protein [Lentinula aciculospora]
MSRTSLKFPEVGDISGQVAVVTGGGTGIGLMISQGLIANGAKVYITGRRTNGLEEVAKSNAGLIPLLMDVTSKESIANALKIIEDEDGKLNILVNNAEVVGPVASYVSNKFTPKNATLGASLFKDQSFEDWTSTFAANSSAPFFVTCAFLALLVKGARSRGPKETSSVINISSGWSNTKLSFGVFAYGVSKAALNHLTINLVTEFARNNVPVRVDVFAAENFPSEMSESDPEKVDKFASKPVFGGMNANPLKRAGRLIAPLVVLLSSAGGAFINGQIIEVDGGHNLVNPHSLS